METMNLLLMIGSAALGWLIRHFSAPAAPAPQPAGPLDALLSHLTSAGKLHDALAKLQPLLQALAQFYQPPPAPPAKA